VGGTGTVNGITLTGTVTSSGNLTLGGTLSGVSLTTQVSGVLPVANGGTNASTASITSFNNITGYTASGATGTTSTNLVFSTSPSITTPTLVGNVTLSTGNIVQGTAAKGINFTANTPYAGMTSQLLNWYEEGNWTPVATATIGAITAYTSSGTYVRVGKQVTYSLFITISNNGTGTGHLRVTGLPFTLTRCNGCGFEGNATGLMLSVSTFSSTTLEINTYNYLYAGGTGYGLSATATDII
jgi:hypothetical protein